MAAMEVASTTVRVRGERLRLPEPSWTCSCRRRCAASHRQHANCAGWSAL